MRVSTNLIYNSGTSGILSNQASQLKTYNQIASGRRILTPADDPVAASQVLIKQQAQAVNTQYMENQSLATESLKLVESQLGSVSDAMQSVLDLTIQAGNTTLNDDNRASIATELQVRMDELVALANTQDANGHYLFSGYQANVKPFTVSTAAGPYDASNPAVIFNGDQGQRQLQVDASRQMEVSESGVDIFVKVRDSAGNVTGEGMFDSLRNLIDTLNTPVANDATAAAALPGAISDALANLTAAKSTVVNVRTSVGAKLSELDSLASAGSSIDLQYEESISNLRDLDYASAYTDLSLQQTQLEASQKAFTMVSGLSLFNMI